MRAFFKDHKGEAKASLKEANQAWMQSEHQARILAARQGKSVRTSVALALAIVSRFLKKEKCRSDHTVQNHFVSV